MQFVKSVLQLFSDNQKQQHEFLCQELVDEVRNDQNLLLTVITEDETQVFCYRL